MEKPRPKPLERVALGMLIVGCAFGWYYDSFVRENDQITVTIAPDIDPVTPQITTVDE